jgi:hypothetical protein
MRDIDFISEVVAEIGPRWPRIDRRFHQENEAFKKLLAQDHDFIGRVLKCHLIIENYINRHLESVSPSQSWQAARLRFTQKIELLPKANPKVAWILPGIRQVNTIRNRFGHRIAANVSTNDLSDCISVLAIARSAKQYKDPMEIIEDFTTVACTWLIIDPEVESIFTEAFKRARKKLGIPT